MNNHSASKEPAVPRQIAWSKDHHSIVSPTGIVLTVKQTADKLQVSTWTVNELIRKRELASFKIGRRRCVPVEAVQETCRNAPCCGGRVMARMRARARIATSQGLGAGRLPSTFQQQPASASGLASMG